MSSQINPSVKQQQKEQEETFGRNFERNIEEEKEDNEDTEEAELIEDEMETDEDSMETDEPFFGDCPGEVEDGTFRLASVNVNNIGIGSKDSKMERLCRSMCNYNVDVMALQEIGVKWSKVFYEHRLQAQLDKWFAPGTTRSTTAHNVHDPLQHTHQWGGTALMSRGDMAFTAMGSGGDSMG